MNDPVATSGLWEFALTVYARPSVPEISLKAQDEWGLNVPSLLFGLWIEVRGHKIEAAQIPLILDLVRAYDDQLITPLRAIRRALKPLSHHIGSDIREGFRSEVKSMELRAEKALIEALDRQFIAKNNAQSGVKTGSLKAIIKAQTSKMSDDDITSLCEALFLAAQAV
jgi:uncharacterized protein (TIGR02444 family)